MPDEQGGGKKILGLEKKYWLWVGIAAAGVVGIMLLSGRGGGAPAAAAMPVTGPPPRGDQTDDDFELDRRLAEQMSQQMTYRSTRAIATGPYRRGGPTISSPGQGGVNVLREAVPLSAGFRSAEEVYRQDIAPRPRRKSGWSKFWRRIGDNIQQALSLYAAVETGGQSLAVSNPLEKKGRVKKGSYEAYQRYWLERQAQGRTPPISPAPPSYGNLPTYTPGTISETYWTG